MQRQQQFMPRKGQIILADRFFHELACDHDLADAMNCGLCRIL